KVLEALHLLGLQPAKFLAPPIIRHLAHPDLADCVHHVLALRDQNIDLPQLRNDLFRLVSLPCHCSPPGCQRHTSSRTTSMGVDHSGRRIPPTDSNGLISSTEIPRFNDSSVIASLAAVIRSVKLRSEMYGIRVTTDFCSFPRRRNSRAKSYRISSSGAS